MTNGKYVLALSALLLFTTAALADEIHSNGTGGGPWSQVSTWRGGRVPTAEDAAIIARNDVVAFDRNDEYRITVKQIAIDPRGTLTFKPGAGRAILSLPTALETYGLIRIDAARNASDQFELRLVGPKPEDRAIKLLQGAAIILLGREGLPDNRRNVVVAAMHLPTPPPPPPPATATAPATQPATKPGLSGGGGSGLAAAAPPAPPPAPAAPPAPPVPAPPPPPEIPGVIDARTTNTMDINRAGFLHIALYATGIDNTGAKANERLAISDSNFAGHARIQFANCDTPVIAGNRFHWPVAALSPQPALRLTACPLAEIRGNRFTGKFERAIEGNAQTDSTLTSNIFEDCGHGVVWQGSNVMMKGNIFRRCNLAAALTNISGAIEESIFDAPVSSAMAIRDATLQFNNVVVTNLPKDVNSIQVHDRSGLALLNCAIAPDTIKVVGTVSHKDEKGNALPWVEAQSYLVVKIKGAVPARAEVEVATVNPDPPLAPNAMDMNIRNNFAPVGANGLTPLPTSLQSLIVRTWQINANKTVSPPPSYLVKLLGPPPKPDADQVVLKQATVKPDDVHLLLGPKMADSWYRARLDEPRANVEFTMP